MQKIYDHGIYYIIYLNEQSKLRSRNNIFDNLLRKTNQSLKFSEVLMILILSGLSTIMPAGPALEFAIRVPSPVAVK